MMSKITIVKPVVISVASLLLALTVQARPEYLAIFAADPYSRPELRSRCSVCHINPAGGGERNEFGQAFARAGFKITPELRKRFPDRFLPEAASQVAPPPVTFVEGSDSQAIVEFGGRRFLIDTRARTVSEVAPEKPAEMAVKPQPTPEPEPTNVYRQGDVRLINLPTAKPIPKGSLWVDFTHRFPFGDFEPTDPAGLFGLDGFAVPSFGFVYGVTERIHVGAYRSPNAVGRPILVYAGAHLLDEQKGDPFTAMARVGLEGRDNFQRTFVPTLEFTLARSITQHAQLYLVPTVSINNYSLRAFVNPERNIPRRERETSVSLGVGGAFNLRPLVALMAEADYRLNEEGRLGSTRPVFGFGIQKMTASRRHVFSLVFSNGVGTTFAQRSGTRGSIFGPGQLDESFKGLTIGFNLTRRLF